MIFGSQIKIEVQCLFLFRGKNISHSGLKEMHDGILHKEERAILER